MAFDWFFKRNFKENRREELFQVDEEVQDFEDTSHDERFESMDASFIDPFETLEDTSHEMFQRMDDLLSRMFSSSFAFGAEIFPDGIRKERNPRSIMLKDPDSYDSDVSPGSALFEAEEPSLLVDSDLDDKVAKHGSLWQANPENHAQRNFSYKKFSSIRTMRPDGTTEEHRSWTDSQGNVTKTVRRSIGDQSHEITTFSDANGLKEQEESFTNLDESDFHDFEKRWNNEKTEKVPSSDVFQKSLTQHPTPPSGDPSYLTLFKKFFGI